MGEGLGGVRRTFIACVIAVAVGAAVSRAAAPLFLQAAPIPVMLLDGESGGPYHDWQRVTPVLKKILDDTGLFAVTVVTAPAATGELSTFAPEFVIDSYRQLRGPVDYFLKEKAASDVTITAKAEASEVDDPVKKNLG